jgi:hypothetical protein
MGLVGQPVPEGSWSFAPHENWLLHDAVGSTPQEEPHPIMAFLVAQRGLGVSVAEMFRSWDTEMADGPMLTRTTVELPGEVRADVEYRVRGEVVAVERKRGRTMGEFDLLTARFEVYGPEGPVATVTNTYALPRREAA